MQETKRHYLTGKPNTLYEQRDPTEVEGIINQTITTRATNSRERDQYLPPLIHKTYLCTPRSDYNHTTMPFHICRQHNMDLSSSPSPLPGVGTPISLPQDAQYGPRSHLPVSEPEVVSGIRCVPHFDGIRLRIHGRSVVIWLMFHH